MEPVCNGPNLLLMRCGYTFTLSWPTLLTWLSSGILIFISTLSFFPFLGTVPSKNKTLVYTSHAFGYSIALWQWLNFKFVDQFVKLPRFRRNMSSMRNFEQFLLHNIRYTLYTLRFILWPLNFRNISISLIFAKKTK